MTVPQKQQTVINAPTRKDRIAGALYGMAYGDALAAPTEFMGFPSIVKKYGPLGPQEITGSPARVTDDTQMALAVGEALRDFFCDAPSLEGVKPQDLFSTAFIQHFVEWSRSPDNNRAPGGTCMAACRAYETAPNQPWQRSTIVRSKGCGANMRVQPVAFITNQYGPDESDQAGIAQLQAAITHGHPTALCAADITQAAIWELANSTEPWRLLPALSDYIDSQYHVYHETYLGDLWQVAGYASPKAYINAGWQEVSDVLDRVIDAAEAGPLDRDSDPCNIGGEGWIAEEAFATALLCFLMYPDDPLLCIRRAAATNGDSDSIACIAGAMAGAYKGISAWPKAWREQIEYKDRIEALVNFLNG
jgi:ADP-ribosylglycohydrolase